MSDSSSQENKQLQIYQEKGLTEKEAKILNEYVEAGKPGLARVRADAMGTIYNLGYSCEDINKMFPEYPLGLLLHARLQYEWDNSRALFQQKASKSLAENYLVTKMESAKFIMEMLAATHAKYRPEILKFLANPEREEAPKVLPNTFHGYSQVLNQLEELMGVKKPSGKPGENNNAIPLVSVTINQAADQPKTIDVTNSATARDIRKKRADAIRSTKDAKSDQTKKE